MRPTPPDNASRSGKKRALETIQALAKDLMEMNAGDLDGLDLPEDVREEVVAARRIVAHGARRRQLRFLSNYIANADFEAIHATMNRYKAGKRSDAKDFQNLESYRERLISGNAETVNEICAILTNCDPKQLRKMQLASQRELGKSVTAARALFKYLRSCSEI